MCVLVALFPMTMWLVVAYVVFFLSKRAEGTQRVVGRALGLWAIGVAAVVLLAGVYVQFFTDFRLEDKVAEVFSSRRGETVYMPPTMPGKAHRSF